jgi:hypothetical protein
VTRVDLLCNESYYWGSEHNFSCQKKSDFDKKSHEGLTIKHYDVTLIQHDCQIQIPYPTASEGSPMARSASERVRPIFSGPRIGPF